MEFSPTLSCDESYDEAAQTPVCGIKNAGIALELLPYPIENLRKLIFR
jgi:hypothetical protein